MSGSPAAAAPAASAQQLIDALLLGAAGPTSHPCGLTTAGGGGLRMRQVPHSGPPLVNGIATGECGLTGQSTSTLGLPSMVPATAGCMANQSSSEAAGAQIGLVAVASKAPSC